MGNYIWIGWLLSGVIIFILVWVNFLHPRWRRHRLKTPCRAWLKTGGYGDANEIRVKAGEQANIQLRFQPKLKYLEREWVFGFEGDQDAVPIPISYFDEFVVEGKGRKEVFPHESETHFTDVKHQYHIREDKLRLPSTVYSGGFKVMPRKPGRYSILCQFLSDETDGKADSKLTLIVE